MKQITLGKFGLTPELENEIAIMAQLHHPNIIALHQILCMPETRRILLVIDYAESGSIADLMRSGPLAEVATQAIVKQMLSAIGYLHGLGLAHNDIKPGNVFAFAGGAVKLGDLGLVRSLGANVGMLGTPAFQPPEALGEEGDASDAAALAAAGDVWALGVATFVMQFGALPWRGETVYDIIADARQRPLEFPQPVSDGMADALRRMLAVSAAERATIAELAALPVFRDAPDSFTPAPAEGGEGNELWPQEVVDGCSAERAIVCTEVGALSRLLPARPPPLPVGSLRRVGSGIEAFGSVRCGLPRAEDPQPAL